MRVLCNRCRIEAISGDWVDLEDSVARVVRGAYGFRRYEVRNLWHGLAIESFSYVLECPT